MLPGENERDRVLSGAKESRSSGYRSCRRKHFGCACESSGRHSSPIAGRDSSRSERPIPARRNHDPAAVALRPRRRVLHTLRKNRERPEAYSSHPTCRCAAIDEAWRTFRRMGFPAPTRTGHIEKSSLRKQHRKAIKLAKLEPFNLYTLRHTCLTDGRPTWTHTLWLIWQDTAILRPQNGTSSASGYGAICDGAGARGSR